MKTFITILLIFLSNVISSKLRGSNIVNPIVNPIIDTTPTVVNTVRYTHHNNIYPRVGLLNGFVNNMYRTTGLHNNVYPRVGLNRVYSNNYPVLQNQKGSAIDTVSYGGVFAGAQNQKGAAIVDTKGTAIDTVNFGGVLAGAQNQKGIDTVSSYYGGGVFAGQNQNQKGATIIDTKQTDIIDTKGTTTIDTKSTTIDSTVAPVIKN
jgi:hypothetical protein